MNTERWLPIVGFEGWYSVSDYGRVRSEDRAITRSDGIVLNWPSRMMSCAPDPNGYPILTLQRAGYIRKRRVHQLVMEAFVGPMPPGMEILHWDGDPGNAKLSNLRYGTHAQNGEDTIRYRTRCSRDHEFTPENTYLRKDTGTRMCRTCQRARHRARVRTSA